MKTIIVFGGSGYIGSAVTETLLNNGYKVLNLDIVQPHKIFSNNLNYQWIKCDLRFSYSNIIDFANNFIENPIGAINLAAYNNIKESANLSFNYYNNNLKSLLNALGYSYNIGVNVFIFSSSSAVYSNNLPGPIQEDDVNEFTNSVYGYTKLVGEQIVRDVCKEFGMKGISLRYFNPIGNISTFIDNSDSLFGNIRKCLKSDTEFTIFGNDYPTKDGTAIRDFIDIRDLANAHLYLLKNFTGDYDVFNVGTGTEVTIKEVVKIVNFHYPDFKYKIGERRRGDSLGSYAGITKINELGFNCKYTLSDSIKTLL